MFYFKLTLICLLVIIPTVFGYFKLPKQMGLSILALALALAFTNLDKFKWFKGAGFEAELRTVNTAVNETYAAIEQVKKLAVAISSPIALSLATGDRMLSYVPLKYKIIHIENIREILEELEIPKKDIDEALEIFADRVRHDHMIRVLNYVNKALPESDKMFSDVFSVNLESWTLEKIRKLLVKKNIQPSGDLEQAILDLEYWEKNHRLRREDKWQG